MLRPVVNPFVNKSSYLRASRCKKVVQDCFDTSTHGQERGKVTDTVSFGVRYLYFKLWYTIDAN